jgi:hypothetical protein
MKNHLKTWASGFLLTLAVVTFCWTARADLQVYTNDIGLTAWDVIGGSAPFYTSVSSANLSLSSSAQGLPSPASGTTPSVALSETFTITNGAGSLVVANTNYLLTSIGVLASFGSTNLSLHIYDITANLTSNNGTPLQGSGATYNFTANGDLLGAGNGLTFTDPVGGERQVIFKLTTGPGTQDQIVLGANHTYAVELWAPAGSGAITMYRTGLTPSDPGGEGMGTHDTSTSVARLTIASLGLAGTAPRTFAFAFYGTPTSQPLTVNPNIISGGTTNYIIDTFAPAGATVGTNTYSYSGGAIGAVWTNWFGTAWLYPPGNTWDANADANGNPNSGSMLITAGFDTIGDDQFAVFDNFNGITPPLNGLALTSFQCDLRFDGGSPVTTNGGVGVYGHLEIGTRTPDYLSRDFFGSVEVQAGNTNWVHVSMPINAATDTNLLSINDVVFHMYGPWYTATPLSGTTKLWVDNIKFVGPAGYTTPPPPTLSKLQPVVPALRIFAGSTSQTYDRQNIATISQNAGWYNSSPGTYSITFTNFPSPTFQGFEFHVFLVPVNSLPSSYNGNPYGNTFVDWDTPVVAALRIAGNTSNYMANFSYKTNVAGGNPNILLASIPSSKAVGTWTLAFTGNTSVTLTTPDLTSTNFALTDAAYFANPLIGYFGIQPNSTAGEGQYVDITEIKVGPAAIDDVFSTDSIMDSATWTNSVVYTNSVWLAGTGTGGKYWLSWSTPDVGYGLQEGTNLTSWVLPSFFNGHTQNPVQALEGTAKWALIPTNCVPANPKSLFFVLRNPAVTN